MGSCDNRVSSVGCIFYYFLSFYFFLTMMISYCAKVFPQGASQQDLYSSGSFQISGRWGGEAEGIPDEGR